MQSPKAAVREKRVRRPTLTQSADKYADVEEEKTSVHKSSIESNSSSSEDENLQDQDQESEFEVSETKKTQVSEIIKQAIATMTNNFALTFFQIKSRAELKEEPLCSIPLKSIQQVIRNGRERLRRAAEHVNVNDT